MCGKMELNSMILSIHHIEFYVSNALQSSSWYCTKFGFWRFARKEGENWTSIAVKNGNIRLIFTTCKQYNNDGEEFWKHITTHGDSVKNVAFNVFDLETTAEEVVKGGGFIVKPIATTEDEHGFVKTATVAIIDSDLWHTLIDLKNYHGHFIPGYEIYNNNSGLIKSLKEISLSTIDHFVLCYPSDSTERVSHYYKHTFRLHPIWTLNSSKNEAENPAMKVVLIANKSRNIQLTLVEPIPKQPNVKDQIQEFLNYNGGPGVQHIAFHVDDIIGTIEQMRHRGVNFVRVPPSYYDNLNLRLAGSRIKIKENMKMIEKLNILVDFDDNGYLLQVFTHPVQDRPTMFVEILHRNNFTGFGEANVKALYDAVARERNNAKAIAE